MLCTKKCYKFDKKIVFRWFRSPLYFLIVDYTRENWHCIQRQEYYYETLDPLVFDFRYYNSFLREGAEGRNGGF